MKLKSNLTDRDYDFLIDTVSPEVRDKQQLRRVIKEDDDVRNTYLNDEKVFRRIVGDEDMFLHVSPALFFEVLLRRAVADLEEIGYTLEKTRHMKIPIFDSNQVRELLAQQNLLLYLADMLSSFTKIESHVMYVKMREGILEKIRFNNMDIHSLMRFCDAVENEIQLALYKRIADICLFILGIFPDSIEPGYRYPSSGQLRPLFRGKPRLSPEDYETEGRKFYKLAAEHHAAKELDLSEIFETLHEHFIQLKKPLNFIADHYLQYTRNKLFI